MKGCDPLILPRFESPELLLLRSLARRKHLSDKDYHYYENLEKGFEGEMKFDELLQSFSEEWLFLNGLLLEYNNSFFQIDTLGIAQDSLYIFDVKYFEGDFTIDGELWKYVSGTPLKNPLHQLQRCESLLKRFLQEKGQHFPIKSYLVFNHPHFTLYQAPPNQTIILPSQINRFMTKLKHYKSTLNDKHRKLADIILAENHPHYPNAYMPKYQYSELTKGIHCSKCHSFCLKKLHPGTLICQSCSYEENIENAILRSLQDFRLLFPERKVTTNEIFEWCKSLLSKKQIQRTLSKNFKRKSYGKYSHYV